ncbi:MarR family winged helix-turn-helix transcriptional regulator [Primorskyibacter sp. 2E107]|uniref:MarR family winged helix-turn-helix transcriptional regulator n=1 Tax=Primorskyibacter sp. 2E107 TaxID=3403458 RepID=UPI003AF45F62
MGERDEDLKRKLQDAGIDAETGEAAFDVDAILQRWRRKVIKRELGHQALTDLGLPVDLAQLDVLMAVRAPASEFRNEPECETMVSTVATRLNIDPSRASRITSELIRRGYLYRDISQKDARRAVLALTPAGISVVEAVRHYKFLVLGSYLKDWTREEIATFLPLLERFSAWSERAASPTGPVSDEVAKLRDTLLDPAQEPTKKPAKQALN